MLSLFRTFLCFALLAFAVPTVPACAADASAAEVQTIITGQIEAFRHDDGAKAYSFASRDIQMMFPNPDMFMNMVRSGYAAVYHPQQFQFGPFSTNGDRLQQIVEITAADGTAWTAEYSLSRAPDGTLKITGCRLSKRPGVGA